MNIFEAFRALDSLDEDTFNVSDDGIKKLAEFMDSDDVIDELTVYDMDAEDKEELEDSYDGKVILDCSVCHSKLYKDPSDVQLNEDHTLANEGMECPFCYSVDGYKVIGQVAPMHEDSHGPDCDCEECVEEKTDVEDTTIVEESLGSDIDKYQKWVDYDMKRYGRISDKTNEEIKKAGLQVIKDKYGDYQVSAGHYEAECLTESDEKLEESVEEVEVKTDDQKIEVTSNEDGKVTVTTEPCEDHHEDEEVMEPVSDEIKDEIELDSSEEEDAVDVDIDSFDEETFESLGESYLKEVYDNVSSYKLLKSAISGNSIVVEGVITFASGARKKTSFLFESKDCSKTGKIRLLGENKQITKGNKAYTLIGRKDGSKFMVESLSYNYKGKDSVGKSNHVHGTVRRGK